MPSGTVSLSVVQNQSPFASAHASQSSTAAGMSFANDGDVFLFVQNFSGAARTLTFVADRYNTERTVATAAISSGTTAHMFGPFHPRTFNDHNGTDAAKNGHVMLTHDGASGDLRICPMQVKRSKK